MRTIACEIGKHGLCSGEGTHEDTGERVSCSCPCHSEARSESECICAEMGATGIGQRHTLCRAHDGEVA